MTRAAVSLEALRAQIHALEGGQRVQRRRVVTGVPSLDALTGGLPCPGIVELSGPLGGGRTRLAAAVAAAFTQHTRVAWVDPQGTLYPPALEALGVVLEQLLVVRPSSASLAGPGTGSEVWAVEQLLRSGCFAVVIVELPPVTRDGDGERGGIRRSAGTQWSRAAERGQSVALVLGDRPHRDVPADVRITASGGALTLFRDRASPPGAPRTQALAPPPDRAAPW